MLGKQATGSPIENSTLAMLMQMRVVYCKSLLGGWKISHVWLLLLGTSYTTKLVGSSMESHLFGKVAGLVMNPTCGSSINKVEKSLFSRVDIPNSTIVTFQSSSSIPSVSWAKINSHLVPNILFRFCFLDYWFSRSYD